MKAKLTKTVCRSTTWEDAKGKSAGARTPAFVWDTLQPGLGLRIDPGGSKAWVVSYRVNGQRKFKRIAKFEKLDLDDARRQAKKEFGKVADGRDPAAEAKVRRHSVNDLCDAYEERHLPKLKEQARPRRVVELLRERWGTRPAATITRAEVAELHGEIGKRAKYEANRTIEYVRKLWNLAEAWGMVPEGYPNPARRIDKFKEEKRDRWVTHEEMPALMQAIAAYPNPIVRAALQLDLLTGCRLRSELLTATWDQVDFVRAELRIPTPKQGRPHVVPLSKQAIAILKSLPRFEGNPHVFPGRRAGAPMMNVQKCWEKIRAAAGLNDVRLHDLRRTAGSWLAVDGNSLVVIGKALGHSQPATTAVYARLSDDPVRDALDRHGRAIAKAAKKKRKGRAAQGATPNAG